MAEVAGGLGSDIPSETPIDPSGLRPAYRKWVRSRRLLNEVEAENIRPCVEKYLVGTPAKRTAPFTLDWIRRVNGEMFGKVWKWAGQFRQCDVLPVGSPWFNTQEDMQNLLADLLVWAKTGMPLIEQAAMLHYRAVFIHPFLNRNGRWARLISNIWLKQNGGVIVNWPAEMAGGISAIRGAYIAALKSADAGDYGELIAMHAKFATSLPTSS